MLFSGAPLSLESQLNLCVSSALWDGQNFCWFFYLFQGHLFGLFLDPSLLFHALKQQGHQGVKHCKISTCVPELYLSPQDLGLSSPGCCQQQSGAQTYPLVQLFFFGLTDQMSVKQTNLSASRCSIFPIMNPNLPRQNNIKPTNNLVPSRSNI